MSIGARSQSAKTYLERYREDFTNGMIYVTLTMSKASTDNRRHMK